MSHVDEHVCCHLIVWMANKHMRYLAAHTQGYWVTTLHMGTVWVTL